MADEKKMTPGAVPVSPSGVPMHSPETVKVKFLKDRTVKDGTGLTFLSGEVHELPADSADHWIKRGVAVRVDSDAEAIKQKTLVSAAPAKKPEPPTEQPPTFGDDKSKPDALKSTDVKKN